MRSKQDFEVSIAVCMQIDSTISLYCQKIAKTKNQGRSWLVKIETSNCAWCLVVIKARIELEVDYCHHLKATFSSFNH